MVMSVSQKGIDHGRLKLEELPEASRSSTLSCFHRVNFLYSVGDYPHRGNMHDLLFFLREHLDCTLVGDLPK